MQKQIRLGMIGTGNICCGGHLPQHAQIGDYIITAMYDVNAGAMEHAREVYIEEAKKHGRVIAPESIRLCSDVEELFPLVDAVDICTSLRYHAYYAHMALEQGVCAMSEKPMARTWLEAARVAHAAQSAEGVYQLNDDNLFIPRFLVAKALIDGGHIGDIESVRIAEGGRVFELKAGECGFSYKHSAFMESGSCILSAKFRLQKGAVQSILSDIRAALRRREGLPRGKSCGCVFKNGSGYTAGELIERAGMKGAACGGAFVSGAHANFIINGGRASAADCLALIGRIRAAVAASARILLQEEICYIGDFA